MTEIKEASTNMTSLDINFTEDNEEPTTKVVKECKLSRREIKTQVTKITKTRIEMGESLDQVLGYWHRQVDDDVIPLTHTDFELVIPEIYNNFQRMQQNAEAIENKFNAELAASADSIVIDEDDITQRLRTYTDKVSRAIEKSNVPEHIFKRSSQLSVIKYDEKNNPSVSDLDVFDVRGIIEDTIEFKRIVYKPKRIINTDPPMSIVRNVLAINNKISVPPLEGITECPIIHRDGSLCTTPGYDKETQMYYASQTPIGELEVSKTPTEEEVELAKDVLKDLFFDFPFEVVDDCEYSRINTYGLLITAVIRPIITSRVPMAVITKPQAGIGSTLIARIVHCVTTGRDLSVDGPPIQEEEYEKKITTWFKSGSSLIVLDNVAKKMESSSLERAITAPGWKCRLLGGNEEGNYPNKATFIATGNNVQVGGDLIRRCYFITMSSKSSQNWSIKRTFKHDDVINWTLNNRDIIFTAIFTLVTNWISKGCPKASDKIPLMGSFEDWRDTVGGILEAAGYTTFLGNTQKMYDDVDVDTPQWSAFLEHLYGIYLSTDFKVSDIIEQINKESNSTSIESKNPVKIMSMFPDTLLDASQKKTSLAQSIGYALKSIKDRRFPMGYRLVKSSTKSSSVIWNIMKDEIS
jgi:hypothetical protein